MYENGHLKITTEELWNTKKVYFKDNALKTIRNVNRTVSVFKTKVKDNLPWIKLKRVMLP